MVGEHMVLALDPARGAPRPVPHKNREFQGRPDRLRSIPRPSPPSLCVNQDTVHRCIHSTEPSTTSTSDPEDMLGVL